MKRLRILVADDSEDVRLLIVDSLTGCGHSTTVVQNGTELLRLLANGPDFDVIVTDNTMPGGPSGLEAMRQLRLDRRFKKVPIILHSGDPGEELRAAVEALGGLFAPKRDDKSLFLLIDEIAQE